LGITAYAWSTWVYRFFLFIGIALLVHHIFPKAIGIILFVIEIGIFIALPFWRELKHWWSQKMQILANRRGRATLILSTLMLGAFLYPWQSRISAPAIIRPVQQTEIFPITSAQLMEVQVENGAAVQQGQVLAILRSPELEFEHRSALLEVKLAEAQWNRQAASTEDRQLRDIWQDQLSEKRAALKAAETEIARLYVRAPHAGVVSDLPLGLMAGRDVARTDRLMRVVNSSAVELIALPKEVQAMRLSEGASFTFLSDQPGREKLTGYLSEISPTGEQAITEPVFTVMGGGPIAVTEPERGEIIPDIPVLRVQGPIEGLTALRMDRGFVLIKAKPISPAKIVWKNVMKVLLRETDF